MAKTLLIKDVPEQLHKQLKAMAALKEKTIPDMVISMLDHYFADKETINLFTGETDEKSST
jgi:hypothetical protein